MQTRRTFFAATSAVTLSAVVTGAAAAATPATVYDLSAIEARLMLPFGHRQVFGAHRLADGAIADYMLNSLNAYEFDYAERAGTLHALGVFYGSAVAMVVDDALWRKYKIDLVQQRRGDPAKTHIPSGGNPYAPATSSLDSGAARTDAHGLFHDASLTALALRKATFFACDNALRGLATDIAVTYATSDAPAQTVHADLRQHLVPGTLLVPAGVAAINQAQEMKFTFFPATV